MSVLVTFTLYRRLPDGWLRVWITRIGSCYYVTTTLLCMLFFLRALSRKAWLFLLEQHGRTPAPRLRWLWDRRVHTVLFLILSFAVFFIGWFHIDPLHRTSYTVEIPKAAAAPELTVCFIADLHAGAGNRDSLYDRLGAEIDAAQADVLLIGGDVFDETTAPADVDRVARLLTSIQRPRYGIWYVYGNHDDGTEDWEAEQLRPLGVGVLEDEVTILGEDVQLLGRLDYKQGGLGPQPLFDRLQPDPDKPLLVLTHRPQELRDLAELGADLALAGHTHGFNIPQYLGANLLQDMYYGCRSFGSMTAITTSGVSAWGYHYKWPAISEVVTVHIRFTGAGD